MGFSRLWFIGGGGLLHEEEWEEESEWVEEWDDQETLEDWEDEI